MKHIKNKIVIPLLILGIIIQAWHFYKIVEIISGLSVVYGIFISIFLSSGLLYWTIRASNNNRKYTINERMSKKDKKINDKYKLINIFFYFEAFSNLYYWLYRLALNDSVLNFSDITDVNWKAIDYTSLPVAIVFSIMIPYLIRSYAGEMKISKNKNNAKIL